MAGHMFSAGTTLVCQQVMVGDELRTGQTYELKSLLGAGSFGQVWRCRDRARGCDHAVKLVHCDHLQMVLDESESMRRALEVAPPEFVPKFFGMADADVRDSSGSLRGSTLAISMEFIDGGSVSQLISRRACAQHCPSLVVLQDVLAALAALHAVGIVHCDVKAANVLVDRKGSCYLCDFGIAICLRDYDDGRAMPQQGTAAYMAPEVMNARPWEITRYDEKIDMWSVGILAYELACGRTPWVGVDGRQPRNEQVIDELRKAYSIDVSGIGFNVVYEHLLKVCLVVLPQHRFSAQSVINGRYVALDPDPRMFHVVRQELVASFL